MIILYLVFYNTTNLKRWSNNRSTLVLITRNLKINYIIYFILLNPSDKCKYLNILKQLKPVGFINCNVVESLIF